jgi:hypothetical protein
MSSSSACEADGEPRGQQGGSRPKRLICPDHQAPCPSRGSQNELGDRLYLHGIVIFHGILGNFVRKEALHMNAQIWAQKDSRGHVSNPKSRDGSSFDVSQILEDN